MSRCAKCDQEVTAGYVICNRCYERMEGIKEAAIKDIIGDDYDIDRLKELVEADRNHLLKEQKTQTNADKIRSMTDEELYDFLCSFASRYTDISSPCAFRAKLFYVMGWLKQPAEED